ncbi:MAG: AMIN domain-containing protein [Candidatus Nitrohelix vancouverensis]|uniref:AMIN domain-containing protein n=1 Tax=Candidatus Nitrohelix vancouverensis TaxID=2705534 RepID=A0A7T0C156_9BACT|nr:MAG: AMIN domain-containing protein [Candidatus Nitrohelix vancouverensis]
MIKLNKTPTLFAVLFYLCGATQVLAQTSEAPQSDTAVKKITQLTATEEADGGATVVIDSSGPIKFTAFKLTNPPKLIVDLSRTEPGAAATPLEPAKGIIKSIRPLYFAESQVVRLEMALESIPEYQIQRSGESQLTIRLKGTGAIATSAEATEQTAQAPATQESKSVASDTAEAKVGLGSSSCDPILSGEKERITLDFQDADLVNTFRLISEVSGFNLIFGPGINGKLNLRLIDVPWNKAFDIILTNNNLGRECFGDNVIRIAPILRLTEENQTYVSAVQAKVQAEMAGLLAQPLENEIVPIHHAEIQALAVNLQSALSDPSRARITIDERTNTLILTDVRPHLEKMLDLIEVFDVKVLSPQEELALEQNTVVVSGDDFPSIPLVVYEYIAEKEPKLSSDLEFYEDLFNDKARLSQLSANELKDARDNYRSYLEQAANMQSAIIQSPLQTAWDNLFWVGTLSKNSERYALVETTDHRGHLVRSGTVVGPNFGRVDEIEDSRVIVLESERDYQGNIFSKKLKIPYVRTN